MVIIATFMQNMVKHTDGFALLVYHMQLTDGSIECMM